jgi:MFS-type transporter involved in bile tolerance (Atg22 family)
MFVAAFTAAFHSQQAGFVPLLVMMLVGAYAVTKVRGGGPWRDETDHDALS